MTVRVAMLQLQIRPSAGLPGWVAAVDDDVHPVVDQARGQCAAQAVGGSGQQDGLGHGFARSRRAQISKRVPIGSSKKSAG